MYTKTDIDWIFFVIEAIRGQSIYTLIVDVSQDYFNANEAQIRQMVSSFTLAP